jgi:hypothetical protein
VAVGAGGFGEFVVVEFTVKRVSEASNFSTINFLSLADSSTKCNTG